MRAYVNHNHTGSRSGHCEPLFLRGLIILGWVANWRPIQTFLYRWPVAQRRDLYRRLTKQVLNFKPCRPMQHGDARNGAPEVVVLRDHAENATHGLASDTSLNLPSALKQHRGQAVAIARSPGKGRRRKDDCASLILSFCLKKTVYAK